MDLSSVSIPLVYALQVESSAFSRSLNGCLMNGFQKERPRHDSDVEFNRRSDGDALGARASGQARGQKMRVLIACEESQEVCKAFRQRGHEAYSCDIQKPSGGYPEWHILGDALKAIEAWQWGGPKR